MMIPASASEPPVVDVSDDDSKVAPAAAQESPEPVTQGSYAAQKADKYAQEACSLDQSNSQ